MNHMAGRKKHSAEDVVRKLRRADELAASGKTNEEIAGELEVSAATLYNWRHTYGGMDIDGAKELKELREQNAGSNGCWPRLSWKKTPCARWPRENSEPGRQLGSSGVAGSRMAVPAEAHSVSAAAEHQRLDGDRDAVRPRPS